MKKVKGPQDQKKTAKPDRKELLALAKVGITALVDEATGYQKVREKNALHKMLDTDPQTKGGKPHA